MSPKRHVPLWYFLGFPVEFALSTWTEKLKSTKVKQHEEVSIHGKVVIITGANSGIGKCTAVEMAKRGAVVIMGCRDLDKATAAQQEIVLKTGSSSIIIYQLDLSKMSSVRQFAQKVLENYENLDILINNAGISTMSSKKEFTDNGWDLSMTTNHLGHFLLTNLLAERISQSSIARVISLASTACCASSLDPNDLMMKSSNSLGFFNSKPYQNSKLAKALFAKELGKRYTTIKSFAVCPGIVKTEIFRHYRQTTSGRLLVTLSLPFVGIKEEQGVRTVLLCSLAKKMDSVESGAFFRFGKRVKNVEKILKDSTAKKVWEVSERFVGLAA